MKLYLALALCAAAVPAIYGQAVPDSSMSPTVGPSLPTIDGIFHYSLSASELLQTGYRSQGATFTTSLSGNAAYNSRSTVRPFSMLYAGGVLLGNQYRQSARTFQNFAISQGLMTGPWIFAVSDSVSYLPQSPTTGLSGIPGVGDLGAQPIQGPSVGPAGGALFNNSVNISNSLSGSVERRLTSLTSASGGASWTILRFPGSNEGLDNSQIAGQAGLNHRLDPRDTISVNASYSTFSYGSNIGLTIQTRGINGAFQRVLSRTMSMSASAGPMWISSSNSIQVPSRVTVAANLALTYSREFTTAGLTYSRGVNGGSGVQPGALSDNLGAMIGRTYGRDWMTSLSVNYTRTSGLLKSPVGTPPVGAGFLYSGGSSETVYGGAQVSRRLSDSLSAYASYNLQHQSVDNSLAAQNAFSGLSQTIGIGITFSPRATRLGQF
ncbi:MAG TPA: hypothetical protein VFE22_03175 [Edaphobacter sp.]|nr:hypothetical protein [Edaphobacter sp.]